MWGPDEIVAALFVLAHGLRGGGGTAPGAGGTVARGRSV